MDLNNINPVKAFTRTILFVVERSSYMIGDVLDAVNRAIESVISSIRNASKEYPDLNVQFKVAILEFGNESATMSTPEDITTYKWKNLEAKSGIAKFSVACKKLNEVLAGGVIADDSYLAIILIACHRMTFDGFVALNELKSNSRFMQAYRVAIGVGNFKEIIEEKFTNNHMDVEIDAGNSQDMKVLEQFTGDEANAVSASTNEFICKVIRNMSFWAAQHNLGDEKFVQLLLKDSKDGWKWGVKGALEYYYTQT